MEESTKRRFGLSNVSLVYIDSDESSFYTEPEVARVIIVWTNLNLHAHDVETGRGKKRWSASGLEPSSPELKSTFLSVTRAPLCREKYNAITPNGIYI